MSFFPVPDVMARDIYALDPRVFTDRGIRFILLDIDNTLAPYSENTPTPRMARWVAQLQSAGLTLYILSNNKGDRPEIFSAALGLPYRKRARKPFPRVAREVLAETGFSPRETAVVGDQIYTDTLCARLCGATAVTVEPIAFTNIWLRLRYWAELPFRLAHRAKNRRSRR
ncbi:MAG: YqeG family HAD IIIA-type phosphatase [Oscillospiraceae bacterium]|nr:YqeG family HAD IIIA-type phosphatase [Oscillospiraceae bacterium]